MNSRTVSTLAALALALLVSRPAQAQVQPTCDFKVPFDFVAAGKAFKAGDYVLAKNSDGAVFTLEAKSAKGEPVLLPVETRIAENASVRQPTVVFDKTDGQLSVAELLLPGDDGYLFKITKARHTHEKVMGSRRKG
jgi:hypothetical protein